MSALPSGRWLFTLVLGWLVLPGEIPVTGADSLTPNERTLAQLSAPMTSVVDGQGFRQGLQRIAAEADLNLCLDRLVDPTAAVNPGPLGPSVFAALAKLAEHRNCVVMPVGNVVLVGRDEWVDRTAASLMSLELADGQALADVQWDDLTTPSEAVSVAVGATSTVDPPLPHDLWAATSWHQIDRRVALTLVLAQFDRKPQSTPTLAQIKTTAAEKTGLYKYRYRLGPTAAEVRKKLAGGDRKSRFRVVDGVLEATAPIAAHRAATTELIEQLAAAGAAAKAEPVFSLQANARAVELFNSLAQSAGKQCVIEDDAVDAAEQIIAIEASDVTLKQLIEMVAQQAGLVATWTDQEIKVSGRQQQR